MFTCMNAASWWDPTFEILLLHFMDKPLLHEIALSISQLCNSVQLMRLGIAQNVSCISGTEGIATFQGTVVLQFINAKLVIKTMLLWTCLVYTPQQFNLLLSLLMWGKGDWAASVFHGDMQLNCSLSRFQLPLRHTLHPLFYHWHASIHLLITFSSCTMNCTLKSNPYTDPVWVCFRWRTCSSVT